MLNLIRLAPAIALLVLPLLGGGLLAGVQELRYRWFVIPQELRVQRAAIEAEYAQRVAEAVAAERLRQFRMVEKLMADFEARLDEEMAWRDAKIELQEQEIADYETSEGETACRLDQGDVDFLLGLTGLRRQLQPDPRPPG
jgi:hypothetical protein